MLYGVIGILMPRFAGRACLMVMITRPCISPWQIMIPSICTLILVAWQPSGTSNLAIGLVVITRVLCVII